MGTKTETVVFNTNRIHLRVRSRWYMAPDPEPKTIESPGLE